MNQRIISTYVIILFFSWNCHGQKSKGFDPFDYFSPPNGIRLHENIYVDKTEVANIHWLEYLHYIKLDSSREFYLSQLPDTTVWSKLNFDYLNPPYESSYLRNPSYRFYPVVGISHEQVKMYNKWRSDIVNQHYIDEEFMVENWPKLRGFNIEVVFRLPTKKEWEKAASACLDTVKHKFGFVQKSKETDKEKIKTSDCVKCLAKSDSAFSKSGFVYKMEFNVYEKYYFSNPDSAFNCGLDSLFNSKKPGLFTCSINDNPPNNLGLKNMIGNVAEMTLIRGVSKGGSFYDKLSNIAISTDIPYHTSDARVGFRSVAEVYIRPKKIDQPK